MNQIIVIACCVAALVIPACIVWPSPRWKITIPLGALVFTIILFAMSFLLTALDPGEGEISFSESIWIFTKNLMWLPGIIYAILLYFARRSLLHTSNSRKSNFQSK